MIDAGYYLATAASDVAIADTKSGGQQAVVEFVIADGANKGERLTWYGSMNDGKALEITTESLKVMGYDGERLPATPVQVSLKVIHDTYNGTTRAKIAFVNPVGGRFVASDAATTAAAKARLKAAMLATGAKPAAAKEESEVKF